MTFELLPTDQGEAIRCLLCGTVSYDAADVREHHCPKCHRYHLQSRERALRWLVEAVEELRSDLTHQQRADLVACLFGHCMPAEHPRIEPQPAWSKEFTGKPS